MLIMCFVDVFYSWEIHQHFLVRLPLMFLCGTRGCIDQWLSVSVTCRWSTNAGQRLKSAYVAQSKPLSKIASQGHGEAQRPFRYSGIYIETRHHRVPAKTSANQNTSCLSSVMTSFIEAIVTTLRISMLKVICRWTHRQISFYHFANIYFWMFF